MDNFVNLDYLRKEGFTKDKCCAPANNRWQITLEEFNKDIKIF